MSLCDKCELTSAWYVVYGCLEGHVFTSLYCPSHAWEKIKEIQLKSLPCLIGNQLFERHMVDSYLTCPVSDNDQVMRTAWKSKWVTWE